MKDYQSLKKQLLQELAGCRAELGSVLERIKAEEAPGEDLRSFVPWLKKWLQQETEGQSNEALLLQQLREVGTAALDEREKLLALGQLLNYKKQPQRYDALLQHCGYAPLDPDRLRDAVLLCVLGCPETDEETLALYMQAAGICGRSSLRELSAWLAEKGSDGMPLHAAEILGRRPGRKQLLRYAAAASLGAEDSCRMLAYYGCPLPDPDRLSDLPVLRALNGKEASEFERFCELILLRAGKEARSDSLRQIHAWLDEEENRKLIWEDLCWDNTRVSLRFKLLAFAIAARLGVQETKKLLSEFHLESLYRSAEDLGVLRGLSRNDNARKNGMTDGFAEPEQVCADIARITRIAAEAERTSFPADAAIIRARAGSAERENRGITLWSMEEYLRHGEDHDARVTRQYTHEFLTAVCPDFDGEGRYLSDEEFYAALASRSQLIAATRERTRRELLKQLCFYLRTLIYFDRASDTGDAGAASRHTIFANTSPGMADYSHCPVNITAFCRDLDDFLREEEARTRQRLPGRSEIPLINVKTPADLLSGAIRGENDITRSFLICILCYLHDQTEKMHLSLRRKDAPAAVLRIFADYENSEESAAALDALLEEAGLEPLSFPIAGGTSPAQTEKQLRDALPAYAYERFTDAAVDYLEDYLRFGTLTVESINEILNRCGWYLGLSPERYGPEYNYDRLAYILVTDEAKLKREEAAGNARWLAGRTKSWSSYLGELYTKAGVASLQGTAEPVP